VNEVRGHWEVTSGSKGEAVAGVCGASAFVLKKLGRKNSVQSHFEL
jgi:hypothetical protein